MLLETENLRIAYGDATAVWDASIAVGEGEIVTVIGPNGAGKTTLINTIAGLMRCRGGDMRFDGADLTRVPAHRVCALGIALVPEGRRLFTRMSVEENLEIGCYLPAARAARDASLERVYTLFPMLRQRRRDLAGLLSGGQQQMVAIGRALMARPRLMLFDEPSLGLAPSVVDDVFEVVRRVRDEGVSVLLVEQNVLKAMEIADRAYVLEQGRIVSSGVPAEMLKQTRIREAYLGV